MNQFTKSLQDMPDVLSGATDTFFSTFAGYLPNIIGAILIFLVGLIVATAFRALTKKVLNLIGFSKATDKAGLNASLQKGGVKKSPSEMIGALVYWIIFLIFLTAVFETLGLQIVVATLNDLIAYLPKIIVAAITITLAIIFGRFIKGLISTTLEKLNLSISNVVANITEVLIVFFGATIAANQIGLDITIITANVTIIIGAVILLLAISLGLGSRTAVANLINGYYTKQLFIKGDKINLRGYKGTVKKINDVAVVLDVDGTEIIIPNEEALKYGSIINK